jgi:hypothetical protein
MLAYTDKPQEPQASCTQSKEDQRVQATGNIPGHSKIQDTAKFPFAITASSPLEGHLRAHTTTRACTRAYRRARACEAQARQTAQGPARARVWFS